MQLNLLKGKKPASEKKVSAHKKAGVAWEEDMLKNILRSRLIAWVLVVVLAVVAIAEAFAILSLAPGKEKVPYLLRVDNSTGIVDEMVTVYDDDKMTQNDALIKYFIKQYINAREGYDYPFAQKDYIKSYYMSEAKEAEKFKIAYRNDNPVKKFGSSVKRKIKIKTFELGSDNTAIVRVMREHIDPEEPTKTEHILIRLHYEFLKGRIPQSVRDITPLGFVVNSYSTTKENY